MDKCIYFNKEKLNGSIGQGGNRLGDYKPSREKRFAG
jgi:hypothetical protein